MKAKKKKNLRLRFLTSLIIPFFPFTGIGIGNLQAWELSCEQKKADLTQLGHMIKSHYAPLELKEKKFNFSLGKLLGDYEQKICETKTNSEFYYTMMEFVAEFKDGHFSLRIPTNHVALMPFSVEYVDGKVFVSEVVRDILPVEKFPFEKGDEVVGIDDLSIEEYIQKYSVYQNQGNELAKRALTAATLTRRAGASMPTPGKKSTVFIKKRGETNAWGGKVPWIHLGDPMDEFDYTVVMNLDSVPTNYVELPEKKLGQLFEKEESEKLLERYPKLQEFLTPKNVSAFYKEKSSFPHLGMGSDFSPMMGNYHCSGETRIKIPWDATIITEDPFVAYYHPTPHGNVGYLRIPHYSFEDNDLAFAQYEYAVSELEANTVGLIIDQDHNCGGSIDFLHKMLSLFMEDSFAPTPFSFLVNKVQVLQFRSMARQLAPNTLFAKDFYRVKDLIYNSWVANQKFTPLTPFFGNAKIYPNPVHYTKPIVVLIDYMSGSGGDAFPTMMQGLNRAKLLGTQTMGLGGHVERMPQLNNSGILINMTRSLFFSPKGIPVENNGAMPDIPYVVKEEDFMDEYQNYQEFYLNELFKELEIKEGVIPMEVS